MSFVVINALTVPPGQEAELESRFAARAGSVEQAPGFEAFELLRPAEGDRYLVYTRWASEADFEAWSSAHTTGAGHGPPGGPPPVATASVVTRHAVVQAAYGE